MKRQFLCLALLYVSYQSFARQSSIRPLQVGDTMPALMLQPILNHKDTVWNLKDSTGQLIILDFISATCGSCYQPLPVLDSILTVNKNVKLFLITSPNDVQRLLKNLNRINPIKRIENFPIICDDTLLVNYFPHEIISHVVWMDKDLKILAITGSEYLKPKLIEDVLTGDELLWTVKRDIQGFDYRQPLLQWNQSLPINLDRYFFSTFTPQLVGISPPGGFYLDTAKDLLRFNLFNLDILSYCQLTLDFTTSFRADSFSYTFDSYRQLFGTANASSNKIPQQFRYCYSIQFPGGIDRRLAIQLIKQDIRKWLMVTGIRLVELEAAETGRKTHRIEINHTQTKN